MNNRSRNQKDPEKTPTATNANGEQAVAVGGDTLFASTGDVTNSGDRSVAAQRIDQVYCGDITIAAGSGKVSPAVVGALVARSVTLLENGDVSAGIEAAEKAFTMASRLADQNPKFEKGRALALYVYGVAVYDSGDKLSGRSIAAEAAVAYHALDADADPVDVIEFSRCARFVAKVTLEIGDDLELADNSAWKALEVLAKLTQNKDRLEDSGVKAEDLTREMNLSVATIMQVLVAKGSEEEAKQLGAKFGIQLDWISQLHYPGSGPEDPMAG